METQHDTSNGAGGFTPAHIPDPSPVPLNHTLVPTTKNHGILTLAPIDCAPAAENRIESSVQVCLCCGLLHLWALVLLVHLVFAISQLYLTIPPFAERQRRCV